MKINRYLCVALIIGSCVFVSYYGGNISYALFYLSLLLPVIAFLYTVYVYYRFKLYQSMDSNLVVKGDWTAYSFVITNEDYITFRNVKVNFLSDKSTIEAADGLTQYCLLPSESENLSTRIKCNYRGEYYVGVDSIEVTDFLYLFKITYPIDSKLRVLVLPRVVELEQLSIAPPRRDEKNPLTYSNTVEAALDTEVRKYYPGDSRKRIHWKASARMGELISRKYQHTPKAEITIFMDLKTVKEDDIQAIKVEDKMIESVLAITNYYLLRKIQSTVIYESEGKKRIPVTSKVDFNAFYKECGTLHFQSRIPVEELIRERLSVGGEDMFCVVVTHSLSKELYETSSQAVSIGYPMCVLLISDDVSESTKRLTDTIKQSGVHVIQIMSEDELCNVLSGGGREV